MEEILDAHEPALDIKAYRKALLPRWVKVFSWIFLVVGCFVPLVVIGNIMGMATSLALFGLESNTAFLIDGAIVCLIFAYSGIVAYGLLWGKDWAPSAALILGILELLVCVYSTIINLLQANVTIRFELILIFPFLFAMDTLRKKWNKYPAEEIAVV
jgi:hypothetical protein